MKLIQHLYGKARVRVLKVMRTGKTHSIKELDVKVMLQGDFDASYTRADNRLVVATDSVKNTVNVLAKTQLGAETEVFGATVAEHFLKKYKHVSRVEVDLSEHCWDRIRIAGKPHAHSFMEKSAARPFARIVATRKKIEVESGIEELFVLKSTASAFEDFCATTLPPCPRRRTASWPQN
jgi:urate oxidase